MSVLRLLVVEIHVSIKIMQGQKLSNHGCLFVAVTMDVAGDRLGTDELSMSNVMEPFNCQ
jgi:hypothetical protein